jgi:hypothetical protein
MHGTTGGWYEIRLTRPGREQLRLFCLLENGTSDELAGRALPRPVPHNPPARLPLPAAAIRTPERNFMIAKDLILHTVVNPSRSWKTTRFPARKVQRDDLLRELDYLTRVYQAAIVMGGVE